MITRDIGAYVSRDWGALRRSKDQYWRDRILSLGAREGIRIADELRRQAQVLDHGWPHEADRREDLAAHVRLSGIFRRARPARRA